MRPRQIVPTWCRRRSRRRKAGSVSGAANGEVRITGTLVLDHCWVCERPLPNGVPREEHHPLPQHAMGSAKFNPTVTICLDHHQLVHDAITACKKDPSAVNKFLVEGRDQQNRRFVYLVQVALRAEALASTDPNKRFVFTCWMSGAHHRKLVQLQRSWSVSSQEKLIERLIEVAHNQTFPAGLERPAVTNRTNTQRGNNK